MAGRFRSTKLVRKNSAAAVVIVLEEAGDIPEDGQDVAAEADGVTSRFEQAPVSAVFDVEVPLSCKEDFWRHLKPADILDIFKIAVESS
jgi:hypothetical protein